MVLSLRDVSQIDIVMWVTVGTLRSRRGIDSYSWGWQIVQKKNHLSFLPRGPLPAPWSMYSQSQSRKEEINLSFLECTAIDNNLKVVSRHLTCLTLIPSSTEWALTGYNTWHLVGPRDTVSALKEMLWTYRLLIAPCTVFSKTYSAEEIPYR